MSVANIINKFKYPGKLVNKLPCRAGHHPDATHVHLGTSHSWQKPGQQSLEFVLTLVG